MGEARLILASGSPRRRKLLEDAGYRFDVIVTDAVEISRAEDPAGTVAANALAKNDACRAKSQGAAILSADTVVWKDGRLLGKPRGKEEARRMLEFLSGEEHTVFTGVAYWQPGLCEPQVCIEASQVHFKKLAAEDIERYIELVKPYDRAGAYDLSDYGEIVVEKVTGSYTNVIGLPMEAVEALVGKLESEGGSGNGLAGGESEDGGYPTLRQAAVKAAGQAYAPYSNYRVGAALLTGDGRIYTGCNVENASFGLTNCAERSAVFKAIGDGMREFKAIAIAGGQDAPAYPCGACRQVLSEFCSPEMPVICCTLDGTLREVSTLGALLPKTFGNNNVKGM